MLNEARATSLDLHTTASLLLDMLNILTAMANNLGTQIKTGHGLEPNHNLFLLPFDL